MIKIRQKILLFAIPKVYNYCFKIFLIYISKFSLSFFNFYWIFVKIEVFILKTA